MTDWNKAKVVDLRAELKTRGLPQTGLKPVLVARLIAAENGDGSESEATIQDDAPKPGASAATSPDTISPTQPPSVTIADLHADTPFEKVTTQPGSNQTTESKLESVDAEVVGNTQASDLAGSMLPKQVDAHGSALPSVEPQELLEDRQKRKRRSQSPTPSVTDASRKRLRQENNIEEEKTEEVLMTKEDSGWVEKHGAVDPAEINAASEQVAPAGNGMEPGATIIDSTKEEVEVEDVPTTLAHEAKSEAISSEPLEDSPSRTRDSRFKSLFSATQPTAMAKSKSQDSYGVPEVEQDRIISPAIHPATAALYIRDFMRPLNPSQLKNHLATLATPPGRDVDPDVIVDFYLDPIRTHAFVSFTNISSASRVRSALHSYTWPEERTRKALWVDFIPLDKVHDWIDKEESTNSGGRATAKKWEVVYDTDEDRNVTAYLQEISNGPPTRPPPTRQPSNSIPAPIPALVPAPRGIEGAPSGPRAAQNSAPRPVTNTKALDELFKSTQTKPLLYWLPVDKTLANKRLDAMDDATSKHYTRGSGGDINRYTFEDGDVFVDRGREIFSGIRPPGGHRGGSRGGFRGGGRGGFRGGFGGGPDRSYDSYRGSRVGVGDRRSSRDDRRY